MRPYMDRKLKFLILILFVALIASSGCIRTPKSTTQLQGAAFIGGDRGITLTVLPGQPPDQVFEGTQFNIGLQVENKGEGILVQSAPNLWGYISITGIDPVRFKLNPSVGYTTIPIDLTPMKKVGDTVIPGGQVPVSFTAEAPNIIGAAADFPLQISALYIYNSKSVASACLKENVYQQATGGPEICKVTGSKPVSAQSAPVKVVSVEETPAGATVVGFNIKVRNVGKGIPFDHAKGLPTSESGINFTDVNKVTVKSVKVGDTVATCPTLVTGNTVLLVNNEGTLFCTVNTQGKGEFVDLLVVELEYGYAERVTSTIKIAGAPE